MSDRLQKVDAVRSPLFTVSIALDCGCVLYMDRVTDPVGVELCRGHDKDLSLRWQTLGMLGVTHG